MHAPFRHTKPNKKTHVDLVLVQNYRHQEEQPQIFNSFKTASLDACASVQRRKSTGVESIL